MIKNEYRIINDYIEILITQRNTREHIVFISYEDLEFLDKSNVSWNVGFFQRMQTFYAKASKYLGMFDRKPKYESMLMHIELLNPNHIKGLHVDHFNGNTLDNRRSNLRLVSISENLINRHRLNSNNSSGQTNVSLAKDKNVWLVQFQVNGKNVLFGKFEYDDYAKAVEFAKIKRIELYGN